MYYFILCVYISILMITFASPHRMSESKNYKGVIFLAHITTIPTCHLFKFQNYHPFKKQTNSLTSPFSSFAHSTSLIHLHLHLPHSLTSSSISSLPHFLSPSSSFLNSLWYILHSNYLLGT